MISDRWKLIRPLSAGFGRSTSLYDRSRDRGERNPVGDDAQVRRGWLEAALTRNLTERGVSVVTDVDPEVREQLEALGYMN